LILTVLLAVELNFSIDAQFVVTLGNVMLALMVIPAVGVLRTGRRNPVLRLVVCAATIFLWTILIFFYSCTPAGTTSLPVRMCQSGLFDLLYPAILYIGAAAGALIPIGIIFLVYRILFPKPLPRPKLAPQMHATHEEAGAHEPSSR
jgi:hypothetical protein